MRLLGFAPMIFGYLTGFVLTGLLLSHAFGIPEPMAQDIAICVSGFAIGMLAVAYNERGQKP